MFRYLGGITDQLVVGCGCGIRLEMDSKLLGGTTDQCEKGHGSGARPEMNSKFGSRLGSVLINIKY